VLRRVTAADLPLLKAWDDDPVIAALMGQKYAETSVWDWFATLQTDRSHHAWVIETVDRRVIGEVELAHVNWRDGSAELRICIGEKDCWNQGYGTEAIQTVLQAVFGRWGLRSVYLRVFASNTRAIRVYERLGFRKVGIIPPSPRRQDPAAVLLMVITPRQWAGLVDKGSPFAVS
jgi:RimJ/RimL family protein N-acetyltransferase